MRYTYIKDGQILTDITKLIYNGNEYNNPTHEQLLQFGFSVYDASFTPAELLELAKERVKKEIWIYDSSDNINIFYINNESGWLDKSSRVSIRENIKIYEEENISSIIIWLDHRSFELPLITATNFLKLLEFYAIDCYNTTRTHLENVDNLTTIEEVNNYDYHANYPEKLTLEII